MIARTIALQQKLTGVPDIARLFALANVAMADSGIAAWDTKYFYQYSRVPNFTPPFPAYPSGHATFGGALFQILRQFFPDQTPFTFVSDEFNGQNKDVTGNLRLLRPATFKSFKDAEWDNAQSRLYLGIHWQFDASKGIEQGNQVANFVFQNAFRPVP